MADKKTSPKVAKIASNLLKKSSTPKKVKRVAWSALTQARWKKK